MTPPSDNLSLLEFNIFPPDTVMGAQMQAFDWSATPLGEPKQWPQSLKTAVRIMLSSRYPMFVWWGEEMISLYNDAYTEVLGAKHPAALGRPAQQVWPEIWEDIGPRAEAVLRREQTTFDEDLLLVMERFGYTEETYFTFSYSPVPNDQGDVGGVFCVCRDETQSVVGNRQMKLLRELAAQTAEARTLADACAIVAGCLELNARDVPFSLLYLVTPAGGDLQRMGVSNLPLLHPSAPLHLPATDTASLWPIAEVLERGEPRLVDLPKGEDSSEGVFPPFWLEGRAYVPQQAMLLPIFLPEQAGVLIAGLNPLQVLDDNYREFLKLLGSQISSSLASAHAYEAERKRAEALAELDQAKTQFFSNVSHEFRTPLTLMLGPLEEALRGESLKAESAQVPARMEGLQIAHRNALRLLKLVNTLLDVSRIEAGRVQAVYRPTDLAAYTADLAGMFRAAIEHAGLMLRIDCPPLIEPVFVDRDMWEKIVLNLLSNAFKHTFDGRVEVSLRLTEAGAELVVEDTGVGIAPDQVELIFERFHRIPSIRSRTHEGSGIGLSLVQDLVHLHGGRIEVQSVVEQGSRFVVTIPRGWAHLPSDQIEETHAALPVAMQARPFVEEAMRWLPEQKPTDALPVIPLLKWNSTDPDTSDAPARILLADDNADIRDYIRRLVERHCEVITVADGQTAWEAIRQNPPDLILSDVMMPRLDGLELLRAVRQDEALKYTPFLLLSARAGEADRLSSLQAGASDYLTKPFQAQELLVRIQTSLDQFRIRRQGEKALRESEARYRSIFNSSLIGLVLSDMDGGGILEANDTFLQMVGYTRAELEAGQVRWDALTPPEQTRLSEQAVEEIRLTGASTPFEKQYLHKDGRRLDVYMGGTRLTGTTNRSITFILDVSKRKQFERQLQESEERFRALADQAPLAIFLSDEQSGITYWNRFYLEYTGIQPGDALGETWDSLVHPDDLEMVKSRYCSYFQARTHYSMECRLKRQDGQYRWFLFHGGPRYLPDETFAGFIGTGVDIHEAKEAEQILKQREELYRLVVEGTNDGVWDWNMLTGERTYNDRFYEILGLAPGTPEVKDFYQTRMHPDDVETVREKLAAHLDNDEPYAVEYRALDSTGQYRYCLGRGKVLRDEAGRPVRMVGTVTDITERKKAEQALQKNLEREQLIRKITEMIGQSFDIDRILQTIATELGLHLKAERCSVTRYSLEEQRLILTASGQYWAPGMRPVDQADLEQVMKAVQHLTPESITAGEEQITNIPDQEQYLEYLRERMRGFDLPGLSTEQLLDLVRKYDIRSSLRVSLQYRGVPYGNISLSQCTYNRQWLPDEVELVKLIAEHASSAIYQAELYRMERKFRQEAETANRKKSEFLALMSHELRTPLNAIIGYSRMIENGMAGPLSEQQLRYIGNVNLSGNHLLNLVNDLLDVSRVEAGKMVITAEKFPLRPVVDELKGMMRELADKKQVTLRFEVAPAVDIIQADPSRFKQILINLVSNAVKFNREGGYVDVRFSWDPQEWLCIEIADTGMGIPKAQLPELFKKFYQVDTSASRTHEGTGLGLALSKDLVELHGGTIAVQSEEGVGSTFTVCLPAHPSSSPLSDSRARTLV